MQDCIFCKIVANALPSYKIYEDDLFLGIMDIFPRVEGHALLIPKKHYRWVYDVPEFGPYWDAARKVGSIIRKTLGSDYVSFVTVGEEVWHAHIHILPQKHGEIQGMHFREVIKTPHNEIEQLAKSISGQLGSAGIDRSN